ncbi:MAG: hypothetical protein A2X25_05515 [Chloroflexi bacterium GWB2_49_20]|nr:MAG: hypothetical protein A2X25_05515 [Chloroflexi bacterium GWB2_49_20]OGN77084.1 MAG: hypothetical protein A2X26_06515 [Chloroflexi bacterium GWC2_49_37]OGN83810.1 MAG: hypothetical protein A2X27_02115 [Chloroflexi bacterium GWD2_49_16]
MKKQNPPLQLNKNKKGRGDHAPTHPDGHKQFHPSPPQISIENLERVNCLQWAGRKNRPAQPDLI